MDKRSATPPQTCRPAPPSRSRASTASSTFSSLGKYHPLNYQSEESLIREGSLPPTPPRSANATPQRGRSPSPSTSPMRSLIATPRPGRYPKPSVPVEKRRSSSILIPPDETTALLIPKDLEEGWPAGNKRTRYSAVLTSWTALLCYLGFAGFVLLFFLKLLGEQHKRS